VESVAVATPLPCGCRHAALPIVIYECHSDELYFVLEARDLATKDENEWALTKCAFDSQTE